MPKRPTKRHEEPSTPFKHELPCAFSLLKPWQKNLFQKRREYLIVHHGWTSKAADEEARHFVAREIYLANQRAENEAKQIPLFAEPKGNKYGMPETGRGAA